ncbi:MAG: hypothetical protein RLZZ103_814, partial [Pseudomonadota bacterium]
MAVDPTTARFRVVHEPKKDVAEGSH